MIKKDKEVDEVYVQKHGSLSKGFEDYRVLLAKKDSDLKLQKDKKQRDLDHTLETFKLSIGEAKNKFLMEKEIRTAST